MFKVSKILETILKYFKEFIILCLSAALIIVLLNCCGRKEIQVLNIEGKPAVRDSIIYISPSRDSIANDFDSLLTLLSYYKHKDCPTVQNKEIISQAKEQPQTDKDLDALAERVRGYYDECLKIQDQLYQANFYDDTLRNDSIFVRLIEEVAENRIQSRKLTARFTLTKHKPRLQIYFGLSGGYGSNVNFGLHLTALPKSQKFALSYYNQTSFDGGLKNSHNIAIHFRIRK